MQAHQRCHAGRAAHHTAPGWAAHASWTGSCTGVRASPGREQAAGRGLCAGFLGLRGLARAGWDRVPDWDACQEQFVVTVCWLDGFSLVPRKALVTSGSLSEKSGSTGCTPSEGGARGRLSAELAGCSMPPTLGLGFLNPDPYPKPSTLNPGARSARVSAAQSGSLALCLCSHVPRSGRSAGGPHIYPHIYHV